MIGIFDSGVGGLSVYLEIKKILSKQSFYYLADSKNSPYGIKKPAQIRSLTLKALNFLQNRGVELIVIACNTATVSGINYYRKNTKIPLIGLVPAIKPAAQDPKSKIIALLTTSATKKSSLQNKYINSFSNGKKIIPIANTKLVEFVENGDLFSKEFQKEINKINKILAANCVDSLVFGCTHFVFLKKYFKASYFYDSGYAVAKQTKRLLKSVNEPKTKDIFATTGNADNFSRVAEQLTGFKLESEAILV